MDGLFGLPRNRLADVQIFNANSTTSAGAWQVWRKRPGCSIVQLVCIGAGGSGGAGAVGANSTAAGGGGGGAGAQALVRIAAAFIPDVLYVSVMYGGLGGFNWVSISPQATSTNNLAYAAAGSAGGNAAGATAGTAGTAAGQPGISTCCLAGMGVFQFLAGQAGIAGGGAVSGAALALPVTGLVVTGGTGGGGLPAAAAAGTVGGAITGAGAFPSVAAPAAAVAAGSANAPPNGFQPIANLMYWYGGIGGGSGGGTSGNGAKGGDGSIGSGGGGGGGAITGATAGIGGRGGDGIVIIVSA